MPQLGKYYTLLRFNIYVSPFISIVQIIILLLKLSNLACLPSISINSRVASIYIPVLKLLIHLAIEVSALVLKSIPFYLIGD